MKYKKVFILTLLAINGLLYFSFLYMDIFNFEGAISSNLLKFISIAICFLIVLCIGNDYLNKKDKALLQLGLLITVFADFCFLIIDYYVLGIGLFCLVQVIYYNRYKGYRSYRYPLVILRFTITLILIVTIYLVLNLVTIKIDFLYVIALFYAICLISSIIESIRTFRDNTYSYPNKHMILLGMLLFLLCDINIAISNITKEISIVVHNISGILIWVFYLPSQVLLSMSGYKFR